MVVEKNKKDVVKMSFEKIIYKLTDKRIPADTGLGLVGDILETARFQERFKNVGSENKRSKKHINTGEILITFIALLCKGNPDFDGVVEFQNDAAFYQTALHLQKGFPSSSTFTLSNAIFVKKTETNGQKKSDFGVKISLNRVKVKKYILEPHTKIFFIQQNQVNRKVLQTE